MGTFFSLVLPDSSPRSLSWWLGCGDAPRRGGCSLPWLLGSVCSTCLWSHPLILFLTSGMSAHPGDHQSSDSLSSVHFFLPVKSSILWHLRFQVDMSKLYAFLEKQTMFEFWNKVHRIVCVIFTSLWQAPHALYFKIPSSSRSRADYPAKSTNDEHEMPNSKSIGLPSFLGSCLIIQSANRKVCVCVRWKEKDFLITNRTSRSGCKYCTYANNNV